MNMKDFKSVRISLASPEQIKSWSYGEVTKPETINYRRLRPEKEGLFCEAIFGPTKDYECACGKYKKIRYRGMVCDRCGVEVTHSSVRRERMGHIELASPVAHIWYTRRVPSYLGILLGLSRRNLDRVLYFAQYIIINVDEDARQKALRHIDDQLERDINRVKNSYSERFEAMENALTDRLEEIDAELGQIKKDFDTRLDGRTDEVMSAAANTQAAINQKLGQMVDHDIKFALSGDVLVHAGEVVQPNDLQRLTDFTQDLIDKVETDNRSEYESAIAVLSAQKDQLRYEYSQQLEELEAIRDKEIDEFRDTAKHERDSLRQLKELEFMSENEYREARVKWGHIFKADMGAEALYEILQHIDLDSLAEVLKTEIKTTRSKQKRKKSTKRLKVVEALRASSNRPEWMILTMLPVIPPDLRPMVQLDGGRFATSDLNDLYRRVINRNNRLKKLLDLGAPDVIVRNEKRMLQEAVDSLIDNSRRGKAVSSRGRRQLKSLSDMLKGKQGRFRRNLLGKRVDYSGRSVIVVGPKLKLDQCGLPKKMAVELFRPFIMQKLVEYNYAHNVKGAKRIIEQLKPEVWEVLEEIIKDYPVLLNRAPTLHRLGIQAFQPVLVEGDAIQIHPLVCFAFNADFDGDQMAIHVPLSEAAKNEAMDKMLSTHNLLLPASGQPVVGPSKDMVLGCYYLTMEEDGCKGEGRIFQSAEEVEMAYTLGQVELHTKIDLYTKPKYRSRKKRLVNTTVGRVLFNQIVPEELQFVNEPMAKGELKDLIAQCYRRLGPEKTTELADNIKTVGFKYATRSGVTIAVDDITVPPTKKQILENIDGEVRKIDRQFRRGLITAQEQYIKTVQLWTDATEMITDAVKDHLDPEGPIFVMATSGATKGGLTPIRQLAGMRGLMADPSGRIIPLPIRSNFREGLTALEYFISTHGARKGLADTALRTADAGYLTRRLVDVAQDSIINEHDCGTSSGMWIKLESSKRMGEGIAERLFGRFALSRVVHPETGEVIVEPGDLISEDIAETIEKINDEAEQINAESGEKKRELIEAVHVRSPIGCKLKHGLCVKCYGQDLGRGGLVGIGEAVGIVAAQSIGEPGTQLTLRTFHTGGIAGTTDITSGLPRVQELFEARIPKGKAIISDIAGRVTIENKEGIRVITVTDTQVERSEYPFPMDYEMEVEDGEFVKAEDVLAAKYTEDGVEDLIIAEMDGQVFVEDRTIYVRKERSDKYDYEVDAGAMLRVKQDDLVQAGEQLTEGAKNPHRILRILGREATLIYLLEEVQRVYRSQGVNINDKHVELILRQMLSKVRVTHQGDSELLQNDLVDIKEFEEINSEIIERGGVPAEGQQVLLGITKAALNTESFLSAAAFQHTINVLAGAAIEGKEDNLLGLKENVILGKLIPAGSGYRKPAIAEEEDEAFIEEEEPILEGLPTEMDQMELLESIMPVAPIVEEARAILEAGLYAEEENIAENEDEPDETENEEEIDEDDDDLDDDDLEDVDDIDDLDEIDIEELDEEDLLEDE